MSDPLLTSLCHDLVHQTRVLQQQLAVITPHPDIVEVTQRFLNVLRLIEERTVNLIADPTFGATAFRLNHWQTYRDSARVIVALEAYPLPAILAYNDSVAYLRSLVSTFAHQIGYAEPIPLISAGSHDYYWAQPQFNMLGIPLLEEHTLLGLPDLVHELGHQLVFRYGSRFLGTCRAALAVYIDTQQRQVRDQQRPVIYVELLDHIYQQWHDEWLIELVCDLVATYLVGPAYGWQHLRLCSRQSNEIFRPGPDDLPATHPADDARTTAIVQMLIALDLQNDAAAIRQEWNSFITALDQQRPPEYDLCYPLIFIQQCVTAVVEACREQRLNAYTIHVSTAVSINLPRLLNEAWERFRMEPTTYSAWESTTITQLRQVLKP